MRLLIVSLDAYSLFDTSTHYIFGGAELRASLFAKEFAKMSNVEVIVVTRDQAKREKKFENVLLVSHPKKKGQGYWDEQRKIGARIKNKLAVKKNKHREAFFLQDLKPTHVLVFGMSPEAVELYNFCKEENVPFIFGCASDLDLSEKFLETNSPKDSSGNDASEYANLIRSASLVVAQSKLQQEILLKRFGRKSVFIPNPVSSAPAQEISISGCDVLWVGKTSAFKRPELFLELAKSLPDLNFRMILNKTEENAWNNLNKSKPNNLEIIESVAANEIENYFKHTKIFVNTSSVEGFPNTFLQAGKFGVPIISMTIDPDQFISKNKFGIVAGDSVSNLKKAVEKLLREKNNYKLFSEAIRNYVMSVHDVRKVSEKLFEEIIKNNSSDK